MKHIRWDFSLKAWVGSPGGGGGGKAKIKLLECGHIAYQIKEKNTYSKMVANILPADTPLTPGPGVGSKGQNIFF